MKQLLLVTISFLLFQSASTQCFNSDITIPPILSLSASKAQYTSCEGGADAPKVKPINGTSYDWWYFDAVSEDATEAVTIIFFTASAPGFIFDFASNISPNNVLVFANFADGSSVLIPIPMPGGNVKVKTVGDSASGVWEGTGAKFTGQPDLSSYEVTLDNPLLGVSGTLHLQSRGPGHYACSPLGGGAPLELVPHVGWANVMPAADATANLKIGTKDLNFIGNGYHDKNWGDKPFTSAVDSWYWGHGNLGEYDIVFFDAIDNTGKESVSGYVLKNGDVVGRTCDNLKVRPVGTPYPPRATSPPTDSFEVSMTLDDGTELHVFVQEKATQTAVQLYTRWIGTISGTIGGLSVSGSAVWEEFKIALS